MLTDQYCQLNIVIADRWYCDFLSIYLKSQD